MPSTIHDDVRKAVARCIPQNTILRVRRLSADIAARHDGVSPRLIAEELIAAGVAARVPIEFDLPKIGT